MPGEMSKMEDAADAARAEGRAEAHATLRREMAKRPQTPEEVHKLREENKKLKAEIGELQSKLSGIGGKIRNLQGQTDDHRDAERSFLKQLASMQREQLELERENTDIATTIKELRNQRMRACGRARAGGRRRWWWWWRRRRWCTPAQARNRGDAAAAVSSSSSSSSRSALPGGDGGGDAQPATSGRARAPKASSDVKPKRIPTTAAIHYYYCRAAPSEDSRAKRPLAPDESARAARRARPRRWCLEPHPVCRRPR